MPVRVCAPGATAPCATFLTVTTVSGGSDHSAALVAPPAADLDVTLTATAPPLASAVTYTVTVANTGPGASTGGTVTVTVPQSATGATSATCTHTARTATCPAGALPSGTSASHTVRAGFGLLTIGRPLTATATRTGSTPTDPNPATATCSALTGLLITC